ncbi:MAG: glycoside hydrolase [Actinobacteria bacterium]|nr:glycoside hydrolase [Actinomycetota bacterium]
MVHRPTAITLAILALVTFGLAPHSAVPPAAARPQTARCTTAPIGFDAPVRVGNFQGFEPSIEIDSVGTIFVTAAEFPQGTSAGGSPLWRSTDDGKTFQEVVAKPGAYAWEGDIALDADDRVYFVDMYAFAESHLSRYSAGGELLELYRPAVINSQPLDDRPWVAAHGQGIVYYMAHAGNELGAGRITVQTSTDGGLTFGRDFLFPRSGWGAIETDPNSDQAYVIYNNLFYAGTAPDGRPSATTIMVSDSDDSGTSWEPHLVGKYKIGYGMGLDGDDHRDGLTVGVSPVDGTVYALWTDGGRRMKLARSRDHGSSWRVFDVTPFAGRFSFPWMTVGPTGDVGIVFAGDPDNVGRAEDYIYGMVWRDSGCRRDRNGTRCDRRWSASYGRVRSDPVGDFSSQRDFFQAEFTPANRLVVPFTDKDVVLPFTNEPGSHILLARQRSGFNLDGRSICGLVGSP